jgi:uncharacterized protein (UPF0332 family)
MYQAAQGALESAGVHRASWSHGGLQATFASELTRRRKLLPAHLATYLTEALGLRTAADCGGIMVRVRMATQVVTRAEEFLARVEEMAQHG